MNLQLSVRSYSTAYLTWGERKSSIAMFKQLNYGTPVIILLIIRTWQIQSGSKEGSMHKNLINTETQILSAMHTSTGLPLNYMFYRLEIQLQIQMHTKTQIAGLKLCFDSAHKLFSQGILESVAALVGVCFLSM